MRTIRHLRRALYEAVCFPKSIDGRAPSGHPQPTKPSDPDGLP